MPTLLLELFSEEIPAPMQAPAAQHLREKTLAVLSESGLECGTATAFVTPRRLALVVKDVPSRSDDTTSERKGPRVSSPKKAIDGFMRAAGLTDIKQAQVRKDAKKGDFYVAVAKTRGRQAQSLIAQAVPRIVAEFHWPKSMRWGAASKEPGALRWARPLHSVLCLLDDKTVPVRIDGVTCGNRTRGHRFMGNDAIEVDSFSSYKKALRRARVMLDAAEREKHIRTSARRLADKAALSLIEDDALIQETAGLVEWPVVLMGEFDRDFLALPQAIIITAIKKHQRCFCLRDKNGQELANRFIMVSNLKARDGGKAIIAGNERVVRARLSDAAFFWKQDRLRSLGSRLRDLDNVRFHEKLGSQGERVRRLIKLAQAIAPLVGAGTEEAGEAARLAKADLTTDMVGEFPDLQGRIGRYYAQKEGISETIAAAIAEHYHPRGPGDSVPSAPVSVALALADRLDMLTGFWTIGEKPTGSKDPYGLRRAALGVVRLILENDLRLPLLSVFDLARSDFRQRDDLLGFHIDRLKVHLREAGMRHDLIDAVLASGQRGDDLRLIVLAVEALGAFLNTETGENLLAGYRRATNIVRDEESSKGVVYDGDPVMALLKEPHEFALVDAIVLAEHAVRDAIRREDFPASINALAQLRPVVDSFFENVMVNVDNADVRINRLMLLNRLRAAMHRVADFSKIAL